jgi:serine protease AprX
LLHKKKLAAALLLAAALMPTVLPASGAAAAPDDQPSHANAHVDRALRDVAASQPGGTVHVLVQRKQHAGGASTVQTHGGQVRHELSFGNVVAADIPVSKLDELSHDPSVVRLAYDPPMHSLAGVFDPLTDAKLATAYPSAVGAPLDWESGVRGQGIGVAVLDSGVMPMRADFLGTTFRPNGGEMPGGGSRVIKNVAVAPSSKGPALDDNGHGTWVAGIIGSRGWGNVSQRPEYDQYVGIAPGVNLINVKVSEKTGAAQLSDVLAGIEWAIQNKKAYNIKVINLSLVSSQPESYTTSMLDAAVELAWFNGITVVVSAGNAGPDTMHYAPANDPFVIVVGATDDKGTRTTSDDQLAWFSSYGTTQDGFAKPDLVAPGRHITSTLSSVNDPLAVLHPTDVVDAYHIRLSGTSAAAPVVSGVLADLFQKAHQLNVPLSPNHAKWLLEKTAQAVPGVGTGAGYPNLTNAGLYLAADPGGIGQANQGIVPNTYLVAAYKSITGGTTFSSVSWNNVSWENVSWENVSWENVSWENVSWENVSWENVSWENVSWEDVAGD